jgi:hypothetical protein
LLFPQSKDFSEYRDIQALADKIEDQSPDLAQTMRDDLIHLTEVFRQILKVWFPIPV